MKKNYLFGLLSLFTLLFAASCQEEDMTGGQHGDTATVTFQVSTPMLATRAVGDGTAVGNNGKLYVAVYEKDGQGWSNPLGASKITSENAIPFEYVNGVATAPVKLDLAKNKDYSIVFWAETNDNGDAYAIDWNAGGTLSLNTANLKANQESYDAFWAQTSVNLSGAMTKTIELKRPFAQLNIGTSDKEAAANAGIIVEQTAVTVKQIPTVLNLQDSKVDVDSYADVTYALAEIADIEDEEFPADKLNQSYLSLNYLLVDEKITVDVDFQYQDAEDAPYSLSFPSVPVQRNYRTNIYGTLLTNSANYTVEIKPGFGNDGEEDAANIVYVTTNEELEAALRANDENIIIYLMPTKQMATTRAAGATEYTVDISAWVDEYYFGGKATDSITIHGNGCILNFKQKNTDWNYIRCVNPDAKWILNDLHLTNSGANNGPWNRHDIRFYNAVELNNVTSDKAIALLNDGKLTDVTIADLRTDSDDYGLWITAQGQTVVLDGCTFNMIKEGEKTGRGIKIADEYVDEPALVNLTVKNTKFNTEAKAAILVTSTAGAKITLEDVDLSGVKADGFNAVWIDEDRAQHADLVTVTGGFCVVEDTQAENNPFLVEGNTVKVAKGVYSSLPKVADGVTIEAEEGTVFTGTSSVSGKNVTIKNVTFTNTDEVANGEYRALTGNLKGTVFENCHFDAKHGARYCYADGDVVFNDCTFGDENCTRGVHFDDGDGTVTFNRCTIYGFTALGGGVEKMIFNDCQFPYNNRNNVVNMYSVYEFNDCKFNPSMHTDCAANNVVASYTNCSYTDGKSIYSLVRFDQDPATCTITFNGYKYVADGVLSESENVYNVWSAKGLSYFSEKSWAGVTLNLMNDIDFADAEFKAIIAAPSGELKVNGNGNTIKNVKVVSGSGDNTTGQASFFYASSGSTLKVDNLKFDNVEVDAEINASGYAAVVVGYAEGNVVLNDVDVNEADVYGEKSCGALVGFAPAGSTLSMTDCDVTNSRVEAKEDRTGAYLGRAVGNTTIVTCSVDDKFISVAPDGYANKYIGQRYTSCASLTIDGKQYVDTYYGLSNAIAENSSLLLAPGTYEGIYAMKKGVTIQSLDEENMATIDCINLNGAENITLKNIKFDAAKAKPAYDKSTKRSNANIISGDLTNNPSVGARNLTIEGCTFTGTFAEEGSAAIAFADKSRPTGGSGNITITGCTFETEGGYYDIYGYYTGYGDFVIENNTFNTTFTQGGPVYLGRYASSTPVVVKGNAFNTVTSLENAVYVQDHSNYGVSIDASNNTFAQ